MGPITCLQFVDKDYLLAAMGPLLKVYHVTSGEELFVSWAFEYGQIYGIRLCKRISARTCIHGKIHIIILIVNENQHDSMHDGIRMALFGGKYLKIYQMKIHEKGVDMELISDMGVFSDWILDIAWNSAFDHQVMNTSKMERI
jgi:hypothetical protein